MGRWGKVPLLLNYNYAAHVSKTRPFLEALYRDTFREVVVCSDVPAPTEAPDANVQYSRTERGCYAYAAIIDFAEKREQELDSYDGVFFLMDDCLLNCRLLEQQMDPAHVIAEDYDLVEDRLETHEPLANKRGWHWQWNWGSGAAQRVAADARWAALQGRDLWSGQFADYVYVPTKGGAFRRFVEFCRLMLQQRVFLEIAIATAVRQAVRLTPPATLREHNFFRETIEWTEERRQRLVRDDPVLREAVATSLFVHPVKLSDPALRQRVADALAAAKEAPVVPHTAVVITTIHGPTEATEAFVQRFPQVHLVVVGDRKTPHDAWRRVRNALYLSPDMQVSRFGDLATALPWNSYVRKNLGYLWAMSRRYTAIVDTDDDTIPHARWAEPFAEHLRPSALDRRVVAPAFPNMYRLWTDRHIWPRGFPLHLISAQVTPTLAPPVVPAPPPPTPASAPIRPLAPPPSGGAAAETAARAAGVTERPAALVGGAVAEAPGVVGGGAGRAGGGAVAVVQSLVDGDPDVDALFRLTQDAAASDARAIQAFRFGSEPAGRCVLDAGVRCAFNSQNTYWLDPAAFVHMYLPATATFRVCDILRSYVVQDALWREGRRVAFCRATARQDRNPHNLVHDLESEFPLYTKLDAAIDAIAGHTPRGLAPTYAALALTGIVKPNEPDIAAAWLRAAHAALRSRPR